MPMKWIAISFRGCGPPAACLLDPLPAPYHSGRSCLPALQQHVPDGAVPGLKSPAAIGVASRSGKLSLKRKKKDLGNCAMVLEPKWPGRPHQISRAKSTFWCSEICSTGFFLIIMDQYPWGRNALEISLLIVWNVHRPQRRFLALWKSTWRKN